MKQTTYRGYIIVPVQHQGMTCYQVKAPFGNWAEIAANKQTARKWIDADMASRRWHCGYLKGH